MNLNHPKDCPCFFIVKKKQMSAAEMVFGLDKNSKANDNNYGK